MNGYDQLQEHVEALSELLRDRHPGLSSWCRFVGLRIDKIAEYSLPEPAPDQHDPPGIPGEPGSPERAAYANAPAAFAQAHPGLVEALREAAGPTPDPHPLNREIARVTSFEDCIVTGCRLPDGHQGAHDFTIPDPHAAAMAAGIGAVETALEPTAALVRWNCRCGAHAAGDYCVFCGAPFNDDPVFHRNGFPSTGNANGLLVGHSPEPPAGSAVAQEALLRNPPSGVGMAEDEEITAELECAALRSEAERLRLEGTNARDALREAERQRDELADALEALRDAVASRVRHPIKDGLSVALKGAAEALRKAGRS